MLPLLFTLALAQSPDPAPAEPPLEEVEPSSEEVEPTPEEVPEGWSRVEPEPAEEAEAPVGDNEIIVWGEGAIRHAREEIVRSMEDLGYTVARRKADGTIVFRPPDSWKGRVALYEGMLDFRRPVVAAWVNEPARETQYDAARTMDGRDAPQASGLRFVVLPSKRRLAAVEAKVLDGTADEIRGYREVVQRTAREDLLYVLPERLDALWVDGTALDGSPAPLATHADRRAHVLAFWSSRADTPTGDKVRAAVEAWLSEVVQASEHPLTADEIAAAEAAAGRELTLN